MLIPIAENRHITCIFQRNFVYTLNGGDVIVDSSCYKHGLCRRAVFICPPVRRVRKRKRVNVYIMFSPSASHTILVFFRTKRYGNIPIFALVMGVRVGMTFRRGLP